mgnify:FL=1|tara:strand:+ start:826 stop:1629 length:804 start_codon:yes stop_codon:yes gene_type:complete
MPELPEVETICNAFKKSVTNPVIKEFKIINPKLRWKINNKLPSILKGKRINNISRRAKYIIMDFDDGSIILHLGMTGILRKTSTFPEIFKHDHFMLKLEDDATYIYNDVRKFGSLHWVYDKSKHFLIKNLGVEPLSRLFSKKYLYEKLKNKKTQIKNLIMNQNIVVGIGNIYASEALYDSKIRPNRISSTITTSECEKLVKSIKKVLSRSIKFGGTSIKDYKTLDGKSGYFKQKLMVYGLEKCQCGEGLIIVKISGRSSFYCAKCQK